MFSKAKLYCESHQHPDGDTCMHIVIRTKWESEVWAFINKLDVETAAQMAATVNDAGKIPMDILAARWFFWSRKRLVERLLSLSLHIKALSEPVKFEEICARYNPPVNSTLYTNLQLACNAVNATRMVVRDSTSHPQRSGNTVRAMQTITQTLEEQREKEKELNLDNCARLGIGYRIKKAEKDKIDFEFEYSQSTYDIALNSIVNLTLQSGIANCYEMTYLAMREAKNLNENLSLSTLVEPYRLSNGDHAFMVVGRDPHLVALDWRYLGKDAVVGDAWSGNVFPVATFREQMTSFRSVIFNGCRYNLILSFNPKHHHLEAMYLFSLTNGFTLHLSNPQFHRSFIQDLMAKSSLPLNEKIFFQVIIAKNLHSALTNKWVTEAEIKNLKNPEKTLRQVFSDEKSMAQLRHGFCRITEIDSPRQNKRVR